MLAARFVILVVVSLLYGTVAFSQQSDEYWGAFVEGKPHQRGRGEAMGIAWNYPTAREAIDRAVAECSKQPGYDCLINIHAFSSSSPYNTWEMDAFGYSSISVWRFRCVATFYDPEFNGWTGLYGNTPSEAKNLAHRDARLGDISLFEKAYCNAK